MKLLPHAFNIAAYSWLCFWLICRCTLPFVTKSVINWPEWIIIINCIALFVACFSKEKAEDEMISSMRLSSIGITAAIFLIMFTFLNILDLANIKGKALEVLNYIVLEDIEVWIFFYLFLFKIRFLINSRRPADD